MGSYLRLDITIGEQRDDKGAITSPASAYPSQLEWTDHTISYDDASGQRVVLDFENRQRREIDERARTLTVGPLQAIVSGRDIEVQNRAEAIYPVLKAGGVADNAFAPVLAEHQLSASLPGSQRTLGKRSVFARFTGGPDIEVVDRKTRTEMMVGARCLMSVSHEAHAQPEAVASFTQFLRYAHGGHPSLLQRILDAKQLPVSVTIGHLTPMHTGGEITVRVVGPAATPRTPATDGFEERLPLHDSHPIDVVLRNNRGALSSPPVEERISEALTLLQGDTPLLGLLAFFELSLEQPVAMPPEIASAVKSSTDPAVSNFTVLLQPPPSAEAAREMLNVFESLRGRAGRLAYLLGAFEAPLHQVLKQREEAMEALINVLAANPRVTGAWKDLGDLFCPDYDFGRAWLCWQHARAIAPTHQVLEDVAAYEQQLEADHPEYFRIG